MKRIFNDEETDAYANRLVEFKYMQQHETSPTFSAKQSTAPVALSM
jgi:hypothetical protein